MSPIRLSGAALLAAVVVGACFVAPPPAPRKDDPEVKTLLAQRRDVLRELVKARLEYFLKGRSTPGDVIAVMRKRMEIESEAADTRAARIAALEDLLRIAAKVD